MSIAACTTTTTTHALTMLYDVLPQLRDGTLQFRYMFCGWRHDISHLRVFCAQVQVLRVDVLDALLQVFQAAVSHSHAAP
jgi:hypothetical protein